MTVTAVGPVGTAGRLSFLRKNWPGLQVCAADPGPTAARRRALERRRRGVRLMVSSLEHPSSRRAAGGRTIPRPRRDRQPGGGRSPSFRRRHGRCKMVSHAALRLGPPRLPVRARPLEGADPSGALLPRPGPPRGGEGPDLRTDLAVGRPRLRPREARRLPRLRDRRRAPRPGPRRGGVAAGLLERLPPPREPRRLREREPPVPPVSLPRLDLRSRRSPPRDSGLRRRARLRPRDGPAPSIPGRGVGTVRLREPLRRGASPRRGPRGHPRRDRAPAMRSLAPALPLPEGLPRPLQLEGLRRQLPRGVPRAHRAPLPPARARHGPLPRRHLPFPLESVRPPPAGEGGGDPPLRRSRLRGGRPLLLGLPELDAQRLPRQPLPQRRPPPRAGGDPRRLRVVLLRRGRGPGANGGENDRVQRRDPEGGRRDLREGPAGTPLEALRARPLLRPARERGPPLPRSRSRVPGGGESGSGAEVERSGDREEDAAAAEDFREMHPRVARGEERQGDREEGREEAEGAGDPGGRPPLSPPEMGGEQIKVGDEVEDRRGVVEDAVGLSHGRPRVREEGDRARDPGLPEEGDMGGPEPRVDAGEGGGEVAVDADRLGHAPGPGEPRPEVPEPAEGEEEGEERNGGEEPQAREAALERLEDPARLAQASRSRGEDRGERPEDVDRDDGDPREHDRPRQAPPRVPDLPAHRARELQAGHREADRGPGPPRVEAGELGEDVPDRRSPAQGEDRGAGDEERAGDE